MLETAINKTMVKITSIENISFSMWENMWMDYAGERRSELSNEINKTSYERLKADNSDLYGIVAISKSPLGFAQYYFHPSTWSISKICYLQDLYVCPSSRGQGIGKVLIESVTKIAKDEGCSELNWQTRTSNNKAISLYKKIAEQVDLIPFRIVL